MWDSMPPGWGKKKSLIMAMLYVRRVMVAVVRATFYVCFWGASDMRLAVELFQGVSMRRWVRLHGDLDMVSQVVDDCEMKG
jgi:hypothetical protein